MYDYWHESIGRQSAASIQMLRAAVEACPEELWDDRQEGTPFWHIAYHALFFCDFYFSDKESAFEAPDFHTERYQFLPGDYREFGGIVTTPATCYSKPLLLEYADHCTEKCRRVFAALSQEQVQQRCGFWWYKLSVGEFLINNLRHTQHHAAQLGLILRRRADVGIEWLGTDPTHPPTPTW